MIKRNREIEIFSLSFLDIISCAFGAIILILLVIKKGDSIPEQNLDINRVEEDIIEKLKVSENIEKLKAENRLLTSFIKEKSDNINNLTASAPNFSIILSGSIVFFLDLDIDSDGPTVTFDLLLLIK